MGQGSQGDELTIGYSCALSSETRQAVGTSILVDLVASIIVLVLTILTVRQAHSMMPHKQLLIRNLPDENRRTPFSETLPDYIA